MEQEPSQAQQLGSKSQLGSLDRTYSVIFIFPSLPPKSYMGQEIHQLQVLEGEKKTPTKPKQPQPRQPNQN